MRTIVLALLVVFLGVTPIVAAQAKTKHRAHSVQSVEPPPPPQPQLPSLRPVVTSYDVYVGGVHLLEVRFLFQEEPGRYRIKALARTRGFWHFVAPWESHIVSEGKIEGARFAPVEHTNTSIWKKQPKTLAMHFDAQHNVAVDFDPPDPPSDKRNIVTEEQKRGALDPLSSVLQLLGNLAVNKSCAGTEPVFDGKRRFDLTGTDLGWDDTDPDDYGVYKGRARLCDIGFKMVAGEWKDRERSKFWQTKTGEKGRRESYRIWLASLAPDMPELAVRAESQSVWGWIIVHLSEWHYATSAELAEP